MKFKTFLLYTFSITIAFSQYDYSLEDLNSSSESYGENVGTSYYTDHVTLHYFGYFTWGTCTNRFGELNEVYENLKSQNYSVELVGIAYDSQINNLGNWANNNNAPIVVDSSPYDTWNDWGASQRDLFILDKNGNFVSQQNITSGVPSDLESTVIDLLTDDIFQPQNKDELLTAVDLWINDNEIAMETYGQKMVLKWIIFLKLVLFQQILGQK